MDNSGAAVIVGSMGGVISVAGAVGVGEGLFSKIDVPVVGKLGVAPTNTALLGS